jgi:hypothetical protein
MYAARVDVNVEELKEKSEVVNLANITFKSDEL